MCAFAAIAPPGPDHVTPFGRNHTGSIVNEPDVAFPLLVPPDGYNTPVMRPQPLYIGSANTPPFKLTVSTKPSAVYP